jgi:poly(3-hydroxyalkanoate) depolymerase
MSSKNKPDLTHTLRVGGRWLHVSVRPGDASNPPLLLFNGIGAALEVLQPLVDALDARREVIRFDVPGIGGSPDPKLPYNLSMLSLAAARLLDQIGHRGEVDVLGFSWGGGLAQHFALQHRRRCRRLVLAATGTGALMVPARPGVLARMSTPRRHRDPEYARRIAGEIYGGTMRSNPQRAAELLNSAPRSAHSRGYYYQLAAAAGWSSLPFLPLIRQPTLVICGEDDPIVPQINAKMMSRLIPHAQLHLHPGGHLALLTEAADLAQVVDRFLTTPQLPTR